MADIKYQFAESPTGEIVNINAVSEDCRGVEYRCLGCGRPMSFVLQKKHKNWRDYFRHQEGGVSCHPNSYLHRLAEAKIKERFDDKTKPFCVANYNIVTCSRECEIGAVKKCQEFRTREVDLHLWYDTCTPEQRVSPVTSETSQYYVADLKLTHSEHPEREPVIIEVWVTHENSEEKRASGIRIIEVKIPNSQAEGEAAIEWFCERRVVAPSENATLTNFKRQEIFGPLSIEAAIRVDLYKSGKLYAYKIKCDQLHAPLQRSVVYGVNAVELTDGRIDSMLTECGRINTATAIKSVRHRLLRKGVAVTKHCRQCFFSSTNDYYDILICKRYKTKGTPHYPDGSEATYCPFFSLDREEAKSLDRQIEGIKFIEVASEPEEIETELTKMSLEEKNKRWEEILRKYAEEMERMHREEALSRGAVSRPVDLSRESLYQLYLDVQGAFCPKSELMSFEEWNEDLESKMSYPGESDGRGV